MVPLGVVDYKAPFIMKRDFSPNFLSADAERPHLRSKPQRSACSFARFGSGGEVYDLAAEEGIRTSTTPLR